MKINHCITACRYGIFTDKFENYVSKFSHKNEHVTIETYFVIYAYMKVNNENKLLFQKSYLPMQ